MTIVTYDHQNIFNIQATDTCDEKIFFIELSSSKAIFIENVANSLVLIVTARSLLAYFLCSQTYFCGWSDSIYTNCRILTKTLLAGFASQKNGLSRDPVTNFKYLQMHFYWVI